MATIYTSFPDRATTGNPARGSEDDIIIQNIQQQYAVPVIAGTESYDYRSMSGKADAVLFLHCGASALGAHYANQHMGMGFFDGTNYYAVGSSIDAEAAGGVKTRRSHFSNKMDFITQSTANQGIYAGYDVQSNTYDNLTLEVVEDNTSLQFQSLLVPFTNGIERSKVGNLSLGTGTFAIPVDVGFEPDVVFFSSAFWTRSPSDNDDEPTAGQYTNPANIGYGCALNKGGFPQKCITWGEGNLVDPHDASHQIRNDAVMAKLTPGTTTLEYAVTSGGWNSNGFELTPSVSAGSEYIGYMALKFNDPTNIVLVDTSIPTSGNWTESGLTFRPRQVISYHMAGATSRNTIQQNLYSAGWIVFDEHTCTSMYGDEYNSQTSTDNGAHATTDNDVELGFTQAGSPYVAVEVQGEMPSMKNDGWTSKLTTNPTTNPVLGFALVIG